MKAAVLHGKEDIRYEEIPMPEVGRDEVLIQVQAAGICGSDIPRVLGDAAHFYPLVLGHEFSGVIAAVGENAKEIEIGRRATAAPLIPCMKCADCQKGDFALCKHYSFIGSSVNGAFADYVKVPKQNVVLFDDSVPFEQAAFFEPATVALHGILCTDFRGGEDVAILGGGTVGLYAMQWCKILGARKVVVFDISETRLKLAERLGADKTINTTEAEFMQKARDYALHRDYGFVFETAGQNATMKIAYELAANKAEICFIGTSSKDLHFPWKLFEKMNRKEFHLTGSWMSYAAPFPGRAWTDTAYYFGNGMLKYDSQLVFKKAPMAEANEMFQLYKNPAAVGGKILLINE